MESDKTLRVEDTPDVELQLLCHKLNIPVLHCQSGKPISNVCTTHSCRAKSAFHCDQDDCFQCLKEHFDCTSMKLSKLASLVQDQISTSSKLVAEIFEEEDRMVEKIKAQRRDLLTKVELAGLPQKCKGIVKRVFGGRPSTEEDVTPSQVSEVLLKLQQLRKNSQKQELIEKFSKDANQVSEIMLRLKRNVIEELAGSKAQKEEIKGLVKVQKPLPMDNVSGFSKYLNKCWSLFTTNPMKMFRAEEKPRVIYRDDSQTLQISKILPSYDQKTIEFMFDALKSPKQLQLLFRASEHGFSSKKFHKYCDRTRNTFVVIKTQYGKTIAGYTPCLWNYQVNGEQDDVSKSSFLLSLDHKQQMFLSDYHQTAISCYQTWGPIFGKYRYSRYEKVYADISICDQCNLRGGCRINYPSNYDPTPVKRKDKEGYLYKSKAQTWTKLAGVPLGNCFGVEEYEVYKIFW